MGGAFKTCCKNVLGGRDHFSHLLKNSATVIGLNKRGDKVLRGMEVGCDLEGVRRKDQNTFNEIHKE